MVDIPASFVPALLGAVTGGGISFLVQRWRFDVDRWQKRIDAFCKDVTETADLGTEFWLTPGRGHDKTDANADLRLVKLRGRIERLETQRTAYVDWCCGKYTGEDVNDCFGAFHEEMTGGAFTDRDRMPDGDRSFSIQSQAADLISAITRAFEEEVGFIRSTRRYIRKFPF